MNVEAHTLSAGGEFPNSRLPLLIYRKAFAPGGNRQEDTDRIEALLRENGWVVAWHTAAGLHPFHHFHSNAHEIVWIASGRQTGLFGGPDGATATVEAGDLVVIPAGVSHLGLEKTDDLYMIGGFPAGAPHGNLMRGNPGEFEEAQRQVAAVPVPRRDPVTGTEGPLTRAWGQ